MDAHTYIVIGVVIGWATCAFVIWALWWLADRLAGEPEYRLECDRDGRTGGHVTHDDTYPWGGW